MSIGLSVGGSLLSGALGGSSSKKAAKDAKKIAREQMDLQFQTANSVKADVQPFVRSGQEANALLSDYLGISSPKGYAPKPSRDQVANEFEASHYDKFGRGYAAKSSNMGKENNAIDAEYARRLGEWETGLAKYRAENPDAQNSDPNFGRLTREFTNEDFVKDPGYDFRQAEGEKGVNRQLSARGGFDSGSALKALARYNQDYASNEFTNAFNRDTSYKNNLYGMLSGTAGQGLQAAGTKAGIMQNSANAQNQIAQNGQNQASMFNMQGANALNNGIQGAIGNYIYGTERAKDRGVVGVPQGGYSQPTTPWYLT